MTIPPIFRAIIAHDAEKPVLTGPVVPLQPYKDWMQRKKALIEKALLYRSKSTPTPGGPPLRAR